MAATITSVSITPNPVETGQTILISVAASFTLNFNEMDAMTFDSLDLNKWDDIGA